MLQDITSGILEKTRPCCCRNSKMKQRRMSAVKYGRRFDKIDTFASYLRDLGKLLTLHVSQTRKPGGTPSDCWEGAMLSWAADALSYHSSVLYRQ